ncbi:E3 ubiquitin-protein ligase XIAP-like [Scyliorhinus canicula]|uniref:E3 ubiquitin-protein ligase XIAP-like n=1 Tax=Scyliorhinus canicula TaxID=7830 RepID=UPI0018F40DA5|nr:E3 ubiquitin-protein ligase XIAP-like [Scyliorhinus canicula]XP_038631263.1 E3 ubiquitin-protein ligase XIAP-like [Scyliorhinus canicula]XP_038631264.1 E3 ubiquitin-protein ligase XIAP-like [Scyliorhinus canicula]XP_038631265.1 E3 ubiquitin-protein ligase XIAP-like [Scyliorhinus canicula]
MDITTDCKQDLSNEIYRLATFIDFPRNVPLSEATLARAGFFYTGFKDQVKCFSCGGEVENWQHGDSAVSKHRLLFPACPFINGTHMNEQMVNSSFPLILHDRINSDQVASHHPSENGPCNHLNCDRPYHNQSVSDPVRSRSVEDMSHLRPKNPAMCSEEARLKTFTTWPSYVIVTPRELAKAGLYYINKDDQVQCFCCGGLMKNWEPGDRAMSEHKRHFPMCAFVSGHSVGNIPIDSNCSRTDVNQPLNGVAEANFYPPKHPDKQTFDSRLQTFKCPEHFALDADNLARAGFYSTGNEDNVKCFHCDGGLRNWESSDEAWEQHAKWFPGCAFLIQQKGHEFVNDVQLKKLCSSSTTEAFPQEAPSAHLSESESTSMQSPVVQGALEMGFDNSLIMELVKKKLRLTHETYRSVETLVTDLLSAERQTQDQEHKDVKEDVNLEEQLKKLKEEKCCKVCWDRDVCIAFVPCGHIATCKECSVVQKCPICCSQIRERVRIYLS